MVPESTSPAYLADTRGKRRAAQLVLPFLPPPRETKLTARVARLLDAASLACSSASRHPASPLFLSGFSLGGNVISKVGVGGITPPEHVRALLSRSLSLVETEDLVDLQKRIPNPPRPSFT